VQPRDERLGDTHLRTQRGELLLRQHHPGLESVVKILPAGLVESRLQQLVA
jgi:hypothetical protein